MTNPFHLGWFMSFRPPAFPDQWVGADAEEWTDGRYYEDFARSLERAKFDYIMIEDSSMVPDAYAGNSEVDLKHALYAPKHDPMALASLMADVTSRLGIVATGSSTFYPPYLLARTMSTLDHLSRGRMGWNVVTSSEDRAAQNYGIDRLPEHDERYDRADEFVDLVSQLWNSWEEGAEVQNRETGEFADHTKVHPIDFQGTYYDSRGPLNLPRSPQGRPVICQAGGSERGRRFGATHADTIIASAHGVEAMKAYRDSVRQHLVDVGRDPDSCKVLFVVSPIVAETEAAAQARYTAAWAPSDRRVEAALGHISAYTENDMSVYDWDQPVEELSTNGHQSTLAMFMKRAEGGKTLREVASAWSIGCLDLVGTPTTVADQMEKAMDYVGGDGFLISGASNRRFITEITDGLVPELQRRGLTRREYTHPTFRDNLLSF